MVASGAEVFRLAAWGMGVMAGDADDAEAGRGVKAAEWNAMRSQTVTAYRLRISRSEIVTLNDV